MGQMFRFICGMLLLPWKHANSDLRLRVKRKDKSKIISYFIIYLFRFKLSFTPCSSTLMNTKYKTLVLHADKHIFFCFFASIN